MIWLKKKTKLKFYATSNIENLNNSITKMNDLWS